MGAWGVGLYSSDFALELRASVSAVCRLPFDADRLLDTLCMIEPSAAGDETDPDHTVFWLTVADQFAGRGVACPAARDRALAIIDGGADLAAMAALGMDGASLARRRAMLPALRARIAAAAPGKPRRVLKAPQKLLLEVGEVLSYPACRNADRFEPVNPYAVGREWAWVKAWKQDGWGALVVAERGLLFGFLAWYRPLVAWQALASAPSLEDLAAPRAWTLRQAGTLTARHRMNLQLTSIGRIGVDPAKLDHLFPGRGEPVGPVCGDITVANALTCHAGAPDDELGDVTDQGITPRLRALSDIAFDHGADEDAADRRNLSGRWRGRFTYDAGERAPRAFEADLKEVSGVLRGAVRDLTAAGGADARPTQASLDGRRAGREVRFIKRYVSAARRYIPIRYEGAVDDDGDRIEGRWSMRAGQSGRFVMSRR